MGTAWDHGIQQRGKPPKKLTDNITKWEWTKLSVVAVLFGCHKIVQHGATARLHLTATVVNQKKIRSRRNAPQLSIVTTGQYSCVYNAINPIQSIIHCHLAISKS